MQYILYLEDFLTELGAIIILPSVIFILSLCCKIPLKKSFYAAINAAIGIIGVTLLIKYFIGIIMPIVTQIVQETGINLPILDIGWSATAIIAYTTNIGIIFFVLGLLFQIFMFKAKFTDIFMPGDLWNNYSFMIWGALIYVITENILLALICMLLQNLYILLLAEVIANRWIKYYNLPHTALTAPHHVGDVWYAILINILLNKIGLKEIDINIDMKKFKAKLSFLGDPIMLGLLQGIFIGCLAFIYTPQQFLLLHTWKSILFITLVTTAMLVIFPKITGIFSAAFINLTEASKKLITAQDKATREHWYIAINDAAGYGETRTLVTGFTLVPIVLLLAIILPHNQTLPFIDLIGLPYIAEIIVCTSKGNYVKSLIACAIWLSFGLYICGITAPYFTELLVQQGLIAPDIIHNGLFLVTGFAILLNPTMALIFLACLSQNYYLICLVFILYLVLYFLFKKNKQLVWNYIEEL